MLLQTADTIFAANRASGRVTLDAKWAEGATRRGRVHEQGAWRVRCPGPPADELEAMMVNTAGGMAGGDRLELDFAVGLSARLLVTSAAAEKVYRTLGPDTSIAARLSVAAGGELAWLPQETILFDRARLRRSIEVDLAADARLLLAEATVFGRSGMGETIAEGFWLDRWRVRREGTLIHAETVRLDGDVAAKLARPAIGKGAVAMATVLSVPGDEAMVAAVRAESRHCQGEVAASAWKGLAVVRLLAASGAALRHDLARVLTSIRGGRLPRLWLH
jgi:urease accessory protein